MLDRLGTVYSFLSLFFIISFYFIYIYYHVLFSLLLSLYYNTTFILSQVYSLFTNEYKNTIKNSSCNVCNHYYISGFECRGYGLMTTKILVGILLVLSVTTIVMIMPSVHGAEIITPDNTGNDSIYDLNICAVYDPESCDIVPQNTPIPFSMINFMNNTELNK